MFRPQSNGSEYAFDPRRASEVADAYGAGGVDEHDGGGEVSEDDEAPDFGALIGIVVALLTWGPMLFALYGFLSSQRP